MGYTMVIKVDGGCRGNGQPGAIGAAAAAFIGRDGRPYEIWTIALPKYPYPTNQRAEITAVILALKQALQKYNSLTSRPNLELTVMSDSRYAIGCMDDWIYKWRRNGWINAAGNEVANRDLIEEASDLDDELKRWGTVVYKWIPREENLDADEACNDKMDGM